MKEVQRGQPSGVEAMNATEQLRAEHEGILTMLMSNRGRPLVI